MTTRLHRLWAPGGPQRRVLLPNFWMKLRKPTAHIPPNIVYFHCSPEMSSWDVEEYLLKVYGLNTVRSVKVNMVMGKKKRLPTNLQVVIDKEPDHKEAWVTLKSDEVFEFPELRQKSVVEKETDRMRKMKTMLNERRSAQLVDKHRPGIPSFLPL